MPSQLVPSLNGAFIMDSSRCGSQKHRVVFCIAPHDLTLSSLCEAPSTDGYFNSAIMSLKITVTITLQCKHGGYFDTRAGRVSRSPTLPRQCSGCSKRTQHLLPGQLVPRAAHPIQGPPGSPSHTTAAPHKATAAFSSATEHRAASKSMSRPARDK